MSEANVEHSGLPGYLRRSGFLQGMLVLTVLVAAALAWGWLMRVTVSEIEIRNAVGATEEEVRDLAGVDSGDVLFKLSPRLIADRVTRHPWIRSAGVMRLPTGKLIISVRERIPLMRVLGPAGREAFYLDREGFQMPVVGEAAYDVPLFTGYPETYHPVTPTGNAAVLDLLEAFYRERDRVGPLISEVIYDDGELNLRLEPSGRHDSMPVRLGTGGLQAKLRRLAAFWDERVVPGQDRVFERIDLRFSGRIIAREHDRE